MKDAQSIFSKSEREQLARDFNRKPKDAIAKIQKACSEKGINDVEREIAVFLRIEAKNLNPELVGDYISDATNSKILEEFSNQIDLSGKSFVEALRFYLDQFKLPGEAQKIDRIVEKFAEAYIRGNPEAAISNRDAAYTLAFQTIMLNTDLHNPAIKNHMTPEQLKRNLRGTNNSANFDDNLLDNLYKEIQKYPFKLNFSQTPQGIEIKSLLLRNDKTFKSLPSIKSSMTTEQITEIFPALKGETNISVTHNKPKPILQSLRGYEGSITVNDNNSKSSATIDVYIPNAFSRILFGKKPSVTIQPGPNSSLDLCSRLAASFQSPVTTFKGSFDYEVKELIDSFNKAMTTAKSSHVRTETSTEQHKPSVRPKLERKDTVYGILKSDDEINSRSEEIKKGLAERNRPKLERKERSTINVQERIWESKISNLGKKRENIQEPVKKATMLDKLQKGVNKTKAGLKAALGGKNKTDGGGLNR